MKTFSYAAGLVACVALAACNTAPKTEEGRADIRAEADTALAKAERSDPSLANLIRGSKAYAVYPSIGKGGFIVAGAYGKGVLYEGGSFSGYSDITQASVGATVGGQAYTEIIVFSTTDAIEQFKTGKLAFDAQATAVAVKAGAGANAKFNKGVAIFTMGEAGLMVEASVGGQRFSYLAK